jgi:hypothetical protein
MDHLFTLSILSISLFSRVDELTPSHSLYLEPTARGRLSLSAQFHSTTSTSYFVVSPPLCCTLLDSELFSSFLLGLAYEFHCNSSSGFHHPAPRSEYREVLSPWKRPQNPSTSASRWSGFPAGLVS